MAARRNLQLLALALLVVAAMLVPSVGRATGGRYAFAGGTPRQLLRRLGASVRYAQIDARRDQLGCEARPSCTARFRTLVSGLIETDTRRAGGDR